MDNQQEEYICLVNSNLILQALPLDIIKISLKTYKLNGIESDLNILMTKKQISKINNLLKSKKK